MNRVRIAAIAALVVGALALTGCSTVESLEGDMEVWGYVAAADKAQLEIAEDQNGADVLTVDRVLAPGDAWIVVHADDNGKPGMRVGLERVKKGESTNVKVAFDELTTPKVIVALHADKGESGEFDFDMMNPTMSPDRPYFVDREELARMVLVRDFGVKVGEGAMMNKINSPDQPFFVDGEEVAAAISR